MSIIVRFAPSPTGRLHIGNIRPALMNWLFAKKMADGKFMLRLDDTDQERSTEEYAQGIRDDLTWLGLNWDIEAKQSTRFDRYDAVVEQLKSMGRLYACYETADELERKRKRLLGRGKPPVYDRSGLNLSDSEKQAFEEQGRKPHWRFFLEDAQISWQDLIRGEQKIDASSISDPILIRADGSYLYTLPSVIDDIDFNITHVIRGEDHVTNSGAQIQIFYALGAKAPDMAHHNLLVGAQGEALSKRLGSLSIQSFREEGLEALAIASHSATIGTSHPIAPHKSITELVELFDFSKVSRAPARFDPDELRALNAKLLHETEYSQVAERLKGMGVQGEEDFWHLAKANINKLDEAKEWWQVISGPMIPQIENADFCHQAAEMLPAEPWDETTWKTWTQSVKEATGAKGKALFLPLRLAITGLGHGPELNKLLPLIGRDKVIARLAGKEI
ncbi:MAG: glutamate--tRNA ligase [Pseudomonadota bacterium]